MLAVKIFYVLIHISLKFVHKGPINNKSALFQMIFDLAQNRRQPISLGNGDPICFLSDLI